MSSPTDENSTGQGDGSEQAPIERRFLIDENLPRELAARLHAVGYVAEHVVDVGLRGHSDAEVYAYAQAEGATLVTIDTGFGNLLQYPPPRARIVVVRLPDALSHHTASGDDRQRLGSAGGTASREYPCHD
jgi:predicted nuclease of predicted toxin-antitoxin system